MVRRVTQSGALPVSRDAPGYAAVLGVLGVVDGCEGVCEEEAGVDVGGGKDKSARAGGRRHITIANHSRHLVFFCSSSLYASPFFLSPSYGSRNSDPGSQSKPFSPLPTTVLACVFIARRVQHFLTSSTRVKICLPLADRA